MKCRMLLTIDKLDKIDFVSGYVELTLFTREEQGSYYVVRVSQYCKDLEVIKVSELPEARNTFLRKCEEYKEKLSQGRPYIEFQLAERDDGLWEFQSDKGLPGAFYDLPAGFRNSRESAVNQHDLRRKTFSSRDEAIELGRTCRGRWKVSVLGEYDIVDKTGQVTRARSLKHIDWDEIPAPDKTKTK